MNGDYLTLAGQIQEQMQEIEQVVARARAIWAEGAKAGNTYYVDAAALNLHGIYVGIERIFEMIADRVDQSKPAGPNWHLELLRQMSAATPGVRPAVISHTTRNQLDSYRGFRHVVRNVYTLELDPEQVARLIAHLPDMIEAVGAEMRAFATYLERAGHGE